MSRFIRWVVGLNVAALLVLSLVFPHAMVGPGKLIAGHQPINSDCFACHSAFTGVQSDKCMACHKPAQIGRLTTTGAPVVKPLTRTPFHQELQSLDCTGCHSDHAGVARYQSVGHFDHALLKQTVAKQCQTCHQSPADKLHQKITTGCTQCHSQKQWSPATFEHSRYFVLDRDHDVKCATCHTSSSGNSYKEYTCYGCHEHTPDKVRREHVEEGIRDFKNCVQCHRSSREHGGEGEDDD